MMRSHFIPILKSWAQCYMNWCIWYVYRCQHNLQMNPIVHLYIYLAISALVLMMIHFIRSVLDDCPLYGLFVLVIQ